MATQPRKKIKLALAPSGEVENQAIEVHDGVAACLSNPENSLIPSSKASIVTLAAEIHLMIFKLLDRVSSTCLGVTRKALYAVHFGLHGKVPLNTYNLIPPTFGSVNFLYRMLGPWMAGRGMAFCEHIQQFAEFDRLKFLKYEEKELRNGKTFLVERIGSEVRWEKECHKGYSLAVSEKNGFWSRGHWVDTHTSTLAKETYTTNVRGVLMLNTMEYKVFRIVFPPTGNVGAVIPGHVFNPENIPNLLNMHLRLPNFQPRHTRQRIHEII